MLRMIAILVGILFIFGGVAGFLPSTFFVNDLLLGYFTVNNLQNIIHIVTGVLAIMAATRLPSTIWYLRLSGLIYTIAAIWGFWTAGDLHIIHVNTADNIFYLVFGVIALYLGFSAKRSSI